MLQSLYLHFPFCKRKCSYCDFCSAAASNAEIEAYCRALEKEIQAYAALYGSTPVDTVFLGGGTPSIVSAPLLRQVLDLLRNRFTIVPDAEFTCEANPGTLTEEWLDVAAGAGVNRLSIGVQAIQPNLLALLGRIHDFPQALEAIAMARRHGITNINADAMFGLPTQTAGEYLDTLRALVALDVSHISAYSLILEEGTLLHDHVAQGKLTLPTEDAVADMMEQGIRFLGEQGYVRYEVSNFAKLGMLCRHNMGYWRQKTYLGFGVSAASLLRPKELSVETRYLRQTNVVNNQKYIQMLENGQMPVAEQEFVKAEDAMFETVMLGLRTVTGVRYADFEAMHQQPLAQVYGAPIAQLTADGLLAPTDPNEPRLMLTERGMALQNTVLMAFMPDPEN